MRGLINIISTIIVVLIMHACKAHMSATTNSVEEYAASVNKVSQIEAVSVLDQWSAQKILSDAYAGAWTKLKVYDTSKPGNPLLVDLERKDSTKTHADIQEIDSSKTNVFEHSTEDTAVESESRYQQEKEKEIGAEERITDIGKTGVMICYLLLILYGLYELSKKLKNG